MKIKKLLLYWLPVFIWMSAIFVFSHQQKISVSELDLVNSLFFKSLHVIEYACLYVLLYRAVKNTGIYHGNMNVFLLVFICVVAYGAVDEVHQTFVLTREGTLRDVIIDGLVAYSSWIVLERLLPKAQGRLRQLGSVLQIL